MSEAKWGQDKSVRETKSGMQAQKHKVLKRRGQGSQDSWGKGPGCREPKGLERKQKARGLQVRGLILPISLGLLC